MFTGIITDVGTVESVAAEGALKRLRISCAYPAELDRHWRLDRDGRSMPDCRCARRGERPHVV